MNDGSTFSGMYNIFQGDLMSAKEIKFEVVTAKGRGSIGKLTGEGETQLEIERRIIHQKESKLKKELQAEVQHRRNMKGRRQKDNLLIPKIALIGYTNAGKSALMNQLAQVHLESEDRLFQTLHTTIKKINLSPYQTGIALDTIGFITNLPHELVESFKTTFEEVQDADVVLHVRDISHPHTEDQKKVVLDVLREISPDETFYSKRMIEVWNKIDLITDTSKLNKIEIGNYPIIPISALNGTNIDKLLAEISKKSADILGLKKYRLYISPETHPEQMRWLAEQANVWSMIDPEYNYEDISERFPHGYISFDAYLDEVTYRRYMAKFEKQNENPEEKDLPPENWGKDSLSYHERKRLRELEKQKSSTDVKKPVDEDLKK